MSDTLDTPRGPIPLDPEPQTSESLQRSLDAAQRVLRLQGNVIEGLRSKVAALEALTQQQHQVIKEGRAVMDRSSDTLRRMEDALKESGEVNRELKETLELAVAWVMEVSQWPEVRGRRGFGEKLRLLLRRVGSG